MESAAEAEEVRVLSVQSWVVHGYVGNRAALVPLTLWGVETDVVNSVQLSAHTGYARHAGTLLGRAELAALSEDLEASFAYSHLLCGYVGSTDALRQLAASAQALRRRSPRLRLFVDPVLGDDGHFYVPEANAKVYAEEFLPLASCLTPNQFELEQLSGRKVGSEAELWEALDALHAKGPPTLVVTSSDLPAPDAQGPSICGFASQQEGGRAQRFRFSVPKLPHRFVGTGDLFSVLLLLFLEHRGLGLQDALSRTLGALQGILAKTVQHAQTKPNPNDPAALELRLVQNPQLLTNPPPYPVTAIP